MALKHLHSKEIELMRKTAIFCMLIFFLLNHITSTQEEALPAKGIIPFELKDHAIVIKAKINESPNNYNLLLDTGAVTFIDRKVAEELDLKIRGNMAKIDMLLMGEVSISKIFAFMNFNLEEFKKYGITLHGIIGSNLLERFKITIDYQNQRVILSPDKEDSGETAQGYRCKFTNHRINFAPLIDCKVNGDVPIKAMVDTGQPYSVVFPLEYLDRLGARNDQYLVKSKGIMIKWPGTRTTDTFLWRIDLFEQGDLQVKDLLCCFAELPRPLSVPLLGKDFLCQFLMTIDYPNDEILFVPYENTEFVKNIPSFGMNLIRGENNSIVVEGLWRGGPADKAGIKVGDEIIACNSKPLKGDDIFALRQLVNSENEKDIELIVKDKEGQRDVSLHKKMILNED